MYYTGFADEAAADIHGQIKAVKELGWSNIEARNIDGANISDISDEKFEQVYAALEKADVRVNCFGSTVANWAKHPLKDEDFRASVEELERAMPRMKRLGATMLRGMSFAVVKEGAPDAPEIEKSVFEKVNHLAKICEDNGILYLHENCMNYGGMSFEHTLRLIDNVKSKAFGLVFDTGNPVSSYDRRGEAPHKKQDPFEFYKNVRQFIRYVHIKDSIYVRETDGIFPEAKFTFPGEGHGRVPEIVTDLLQTGYDGGFSIEPHMAVVYHEDERMSEDEARFNTFVEYGRRFMKLVEEVKT